MNKNDNKLLKSLLVIMAYASLAALISMCTVNSFHKCEIGGPAGSVEICR